MLLLLLKPKVTQTLTGTGPGPLAGVRGASVLAAAGGPVLTGPQATARTDRPRV